MQILVIFTHRFSKLMNHEVKHLTKDKLVANKEALLTKFGEGRKVVEESCLKLKEKASAMKKKFMDL